MMQVRIGTEPTFTIEPNARELFDGSNHPILDVGRGWDLMPDGETFITPKAVASDNEEDSARRIVIVEHWLNEVERVVPAD